MMNGESLDWKVYEACHTTLTLDGLEDILEIKEVQASWAHAALLNAQEEAAEKAGR
jgi:hypothetical protein